MKPLMLPLLASMLTLIGCTPNAERDLSLALLRGMAYQNGDVGAIAVTDTLAGFNQAERGSSQTVVVVANAPSASEPTGSVISGGNAPQPDRKDMGLLMSCRAAFHGAGLDRPMPGDFEVFRDRVSFEADKKPYKFSFGLEGITNIIYFEADRLVITTAIEQREYKWEFTFGEENGRIVTEQIHRLNPAIQYSPTSNSSELPTTESPPMALPSQTGGPPK